MSKPARLPYVYELPTNDPDHHDVFAPGARLKEAPPTKSDGRATKTASCPPDNNG